MNNTATPYITNSIFVIGKNLFPFLIYAFSSTIFVLPIFYGLDVKGNQIFSSLLLFFLYPAVWGKYSEIIISDQKDSYFSLFKKHWFNIFLVNLIFKIPYAIFIYVLATFEIEADNAATVFSIILNMLSIYILPLVFINQTIWESIKIGLQCIIGNLIFNIPYLFILILTSIMGLISIKFLIGALSNKGYVIVYCIFVSVNIFLELVIFISATTVLKEKLL